MSCGLRQRNGPRLIGATNQPVPFLAVLACSIGGG
jgi:hypothetical protein